MLVFDCLDRFCIIHISSRIFEWKPEKSRNYRPISDCTIIMKNMFTVEEMMVCWALLRDCILNHFP